MTRDEQREAVTVQEVDAPYRLDDGPLRNKGDWPGTFFRGDTSASYASTLRALHMLDPKLQQRFLGELADEFCKCIVRTRDPRP